MEKKDIDALVRDSVREVSTTDYKEIIGDLGKDGVKLDFLRDICSFANTRGGVIYFGVSERRDANGKKTGEPEEALGLPSFNGEEEISKINNIVASRLEPRIVVDMEPVYGFPRGPVLVLRVPQSWIGPHMEKDDGRFYMRDSTGKKLMDYHMLRSSFLSFKTIRDDVRAFHQERVRAIFGNNTPLPLNPGSRLVIHSLPISSFVPATRRLIPLHKLESRASALSFEHTVQRGRPNLDGWVIPHSSSTGSTEYVQMFRNGILERVHTGFTVAERDGLYVRGNDIIEAIGQGIDRFVQVQLSLDIEPPIVLMVAVRGVAGHKLVHSKQSNFGVLAERFSQGGFDRDELVLPEIVWESKAAALDVLAQDLIDIFWQAGGTNETAPSLKNYQA